jgi:glyoxylase-like metal-dependent hydrolase (beta-lactamase superfamily II)/rhodanese-related sulfurtransferase
MYIEQIYTNCLAEAAYYVESNGEAAIIDPLRDTEIYIQLAKSRGAKIKYILETHFHADFVSGHIDLAAETGAPIVFGPGAKTSYAIKNVKDNELLPLGSINIKVLHTPGHTPESVSYLLLDEANKEHALFSGDTLFIGDVGRPDLMGVKMTKEGLASMMFDSLQNKIKVLPDDVIVYPGHGAGSACGKNISKETVSTIGKQKQSNYAMQKMSREDFIKVVTDGLGAPPAYFPFDAVKNKNGYPSLSEIKKKSMQPLSPNEFVNQMKQGHFILDTRKAESFAKGFVKGSINIGLEGQYAVWVGALVPPESTILLVTDPGKEEESIVRLARIGYDAVIGYLDGGMAKWILENKPIDKIEEVNADNFASQYNQGKLNILDVRNHGEHQSGILKGAQAICLSKLSKEIENLKSSNTYFVHCAGGYRSMMACSLLKKNNFLNVINIQGGMQFLKNKKLPMEMLPVC